MTDIIKKTNRFQVIIYILSFLFLFFTVIQTNTARYILTGRAETSDLTIKLALQGNFDQNKHSSYKTKVVLYGREGKVKELADQTLSYDNQNIFKLQVNLNDINFNQMYALFIKPDKYTGKLFCNQESSSTNCTTPQMVFKTGANNLDLTRDIILAGDLADQNGKVDSYDLSKILGDIGKISNDYLESDINGDGIVNALDYSLTLYSLSKNATDDTINLITPTPSVSIEPTSTSVPATTNTPPPEATNTPPPQNTPTPEPSNTPVPTTTSVPTPTQPVVQGGTCYGTLNGKAYVNAGIFGNQCRIINNEKHHYCVSGQNECTPEKCVEEVKKTVKELLPSCSNGIATLDEQKTQVTCQTEYISESCTPEPTPSCEDNRQKC